jgi:multiple antibiotic resistance protein
VALICLGACLAATRIEAALGASGALVLAKLLGVLLAALAVQYVVDGARALLTG